MKGEIGEAITFLEANKEKEPLRNAIKKHKSILHLASDHWVKFEGKHVDESILRSLWEMETHQFNSYHKKCLKTHLN